MESETEITNVTPTEEDVAAAEILAEWLRPKYLRPNFVIHAGSVIAKAREEGARVGAGWRPEVVHFANAMEARLRRNDHKPGWRGDSSMDLYWRLLDEAKELAVAVGIQRRRIWDQTVEEFVLKDCFIPGTEKCYDAVLSEAADVANSAMMIADNWKYFIEAEDAARTTATGALTEKAQAELEHTVSVGGFACDVEQATTTATGAAERGDVG